MAPKRATRSTPVTTTTDPTATATTNVTNAQLQAMIDQGVSAALAARDATRNGTDSHSSGTGGQRDLERGWLESDIPGFHEVQTLGISKATEGVRCFPEERIKLKGMSGGFSRHDSMETSVASKPKKNKQEASRNGHKMRDKHSQYHGGKQAETRGRALRKECPRLKSKKANRGTASWEWMRAPAKVYVVGNAGANPDNVVAGTDLSTGAFYLKELSEQLKELPTNGFIEPSSSPWGGSGPICPEEGRSIRICALIPRTE
ncbi:hypothetical protein Tco_0267269 [Tanacetum coccineum]